MSDRLPPLTALRAFEAAARHMSFAKAAEELSVTPAALSFQIKSLEEHLGQQVFHRLNRAVELTEAGRALLRLWAGVNLFMRRGIRFYPGKAGCLCLIPRVNMRSDLRSIGRLLHLFIS